MNVNGEKMNQHLLQNKTALNFLLAGKATVTFKNNETGNRFTYRINKPKNPNSPHFVAVMTGTNNELSYHYLGIIWNSDRYVYGVKSKISKNALVAGVVVN